MRGCEGRWDHQGLTCREIAHQTSKFLDDHLPVPTQSRMTLHLPACGHCRAYVKQIGFVQQSLALLSKQKFAPLNQSFLRRQFSAHHTQ
jgi:predicted anti-sigma-YlaC factor YlaD